MYLASLLTVVAMAITGLAPPQMSVLRTAISPSGRYSLAVAIPNETSTNADKGWLPFTYTLTDTHTGKEVWARAQGATRFKGGPVAIPTEMLAREFFVADDATVLALMNDGSLADIRHAAGDGSTSLPLGTLFIGGEGANKGLAWIQRSGRATFLEVPGADENSPPRLCLVLRAYWGEHLVFDAHSCALLAREYAPVGGDARPLPSSAESDRVLQFAFAQEKAWCRSTLAAAAAALPAMTDQAGKRDLEAALANAASFNLTDTIPVIRKIEVAAAPFSARLSPDEWLKRHNEDKAATNAALARMTSGASIEHTMNSMAENSQRQADRQWNTLVPAVHQSLRQLGEAPHLGVGVQLFGAMQVLAPGSRDARLAVDLLPADERLKALPLIKPGVKLGEVIDALGCADDLIRGTSFTPSIYFYHLDTPNPFTLRITLAPDHFTVKSVEEIRPPLWRTGDLKRTVTTR